MAARPAPRRHERRRGRNDERSTASPAAVEQAAWVSVLLVCLTVVLRSPLVGLAGGVLWIVVPRAWRRHQHRRARQALEAEIVAVVDQLTQQVRSGASLSGGFVQVVEQRPLARAALDRVLASVAAGDRLPVALDRAAGLADTPVSLGLFGAFLAVLTTEGGPAGPSLERLSETLRTARAAENEALAQASQACASALLLSALPLCFAGLLVLVEPDVRTFYLHRFSGALCVTAMLLLSAGGWSWIERSLWGRSTRRRVAETRLRDVVSTLDLAAVVLGAGGTTAEALRLLHDRGPETIRSPIGELLTRWRSGVGLSAVLLELPDRAGEEYRAFASAMVSTERDGAPVAALLARLGEEARLNRRRVAEIRARRLSVQLLLPLVCCSLPAVIVGAVVPLVVVSVGRVA